jgi:hypothetical protein
MDGAKLFGYNLVCWLEENLDCSNGVRSDELIGQVVINKGVISFRFLNGGWFMQGEYDINEQKKKEKDRLRKREERKHKDHNRREVL